MMKTCSRCGEEKARDEFNVRSVALDGKQPWCRGCFRMYQREKKYGLTPDEINAMLAGGCEVCGTHSDLCIDHDHLTGLVRGVLCDWHNRALGLLHDDPAVVASLLAYRLRFVDEVVMPHVSP